VTQPFVDRGYLTGVQYASEKNLAARQAIYRFQEPPVRNAVWALDLADLGGDECVLDVGCGNGAHLGELAARSHRGTVCGMDLSAGMLAAARRRSGAALSVGDAERLPFPGDVFDRVLAMHMLYHVPDRDVAIAEIRRVLCPGGTALFLTNSDTHLAELNAMVASAVDDIAGIGSGGRRAYVGFSSESGAPELERHFASVERHDVRSQLVVTEVEPMVAYVSSMGWIMHATPELTGSVLDEIARRTRAAIDETGAFRTRTDVGCFVCR
jgi:SAM-dependent methyltransferase